MFSPLFTFLELTLDLLKVLPIRDQLQGTANSPSDVAGTSSRSITRREEDWHYQHQQAATITTRSSSNRMTIEATT
ncbi:MAG: hypothetical protein CMJ45_00430 [Planctomyces sp.]|nr:hypothetical protein [Planctomyces sp.]